MRVRMVETGVANVASVRAAFERLGTRVAPAACADDVESADAVVLPGVGAFGAGVRALGALGVTDALIARIRAGRPTLAICLGMQLLGRSSAESPNVRGLGVLPVDVVPLASEQLPHFGWNRIVADETCRMLCDGATYFAHGYCVDDTEALRAAGFGVAHAVEGQSFVAALERDGLLACQFHPELSGAFGAALLGRWLEGARQRSSTRPEAGAIRW